MNRIITQKKNKKGYINTKSMAPIHRFIFPININRNPKEPNARKASSSPRMSSIPMNNALKIVKNVRRILIGIFTRKHGMSD